MACLDERTMYALLDGELKGDARREAMKHIKGCDKCLARMRNVVSFERTLREAWRKFRKEECLTFETLYAYSEGTLPPKEHANVKKHLAQCAACWLVLKEGAWLAEEYTRQEQEWLKSNEERLGKRLYARVRQFLEERFEKAKELVSSADMYLWQLQPVPVFRGGKPPERHEEPIPVVCRSDSVVIVVTGREPKGLQLRLVDENGKEVAVQSCSAEGIATFQDIPAGYYSVELVEP